MDKREVISKVAKYKKLVKKEFDLDKIILFGSYARGNYHDDSDIDVAVLVNTSGMDFFEYNSKLRKLRRQIDLRIEPIFFEKNYEDKSGFLSDILKNGYII